METNNKILTCKTEVYEILVGPEANLEPCQTSTVELLAVNYFRKNTLSHMFDRALNGSRYSRMDQVKFVEDSL